MERNSENSTILGKYLETGLWDIVLIKSIFTLDDSKTVHFSYSEYSDLNDNLCHVLKITNIRLHNNYEDNIFTKKMKGLSLGKVQNYISHKFWRNLQKKKKRNHNNKWKSKNSNMMFQVMSLM